MHVWKGWNHGRAHSQSGVPRVSKMRVCVLASGSSGNSTYIGHEDTHILIDAGISKKLIANRLSEIGVEPKQITALLVTHGHVDHCGHVYSVHRHFGTRVYVGSATLSAINNRNDDYGIPSITDLQNIDGERTIGSLKVTSFPVPHSSPTGAFYGRSAHAWGRATQGFKFADTRGKTVGYATDLGHVTEDVENNLNGCNAIILESNHSEHLVDEALCLIEGKLGTKTATSYGRSRHEIGIGIRERWVRSEVGHLSNEQCGRALANLIGEDTNHVFLAHMSEDYNTWELAHGTVSNILGGNDDQYVPVTTSFNGKFLNATLDTFSQLEMPNPAKKKKMRAALKNPNVKIHRTYREGKSGQRSELLEF